MTKLICHLNLYYKVNFVTAIFCFLICWKSTSQSNTTLATKYNIIAERNGNTVRYKPGTAFVIKYTDSAGLQRLKGRFVSAYKNSITIQTRDRLNEFVSIKTSAILLLRKIKPKRRKTYAIIGGSLIAVSTALMDKGADSPGGALRDALLVPVLGVGAYFLYAIPVTLLIERLSEKRRTNGWLFTIAQ